jgi:hypothetical protein
VNRLIGAYYAGTRLDDFGLWRFPRKHFRAELRNGVFVKLNGPRRARLDARDLQGIASRLAPMHLYMSVLDYLFPERVSGKDRTDCYPVGGELLVDVDSYLFRRPHWHSFEAHGVCDGCLEISKALTLQASDEIRRYYSDQAVVFSGRRGYHLHVLDFDVHDWVRYDPRDPFGSQAAARFRFLKLIEPVSHVFDRIHFRVSVDPLRIASVPGSVNGETGLVCRFVGTPSDLERRSVRSILDESATLMVAPIPRGK